MSELGKAFLLGVVIFAVWLFAVLQVHSRAAIEGGRFPPKQYDHPFKGKIIVRLVEIDDPHEYAFVWDGAAESGICVIYMNQRLLWTKREWADTLRHEIGHCNGWSADHIPRGR